MVVSGGVMSRMATFMSFDPRSWAIWRPMPALPPVRIITSLFQL